MSSPNQKQFPGDEKAADDRRGPDRRGNRVELPGTNAEDGLAQMRAAWMVQKGCEAQAEALLRPHK